MFKRVLVFFQANILKIGRSKDGFGMNELLGIAAALIIAAFIIIPGLKGFTDTVMDGLTSWWTTTVLTKIFPTA